MTSGNPNLAKVSKRGYEIEEIASRFLQWEGYEIIFGIRAAIRKSKERIIGKHKIRTPLGEGWIYHRRPLTLKERQVKKTTRQKLKEVFGYRISPSDYFCEKNNQYYVIDVKHKSYKPNKTMDQFTVTKQEVSRYDKFTKEGKVKVKILRVLEKDSKLSYKMYDWNEFVVSAGRTSIRLKRTSINCIYRKKAVS